MLFLIQTGLIVFHLLAWLGVVHVLLSKEDPRSALGWAAILLLVPAIGLFLYLVFGISRTQSRAAAIMRQHVGQLPHYASHPTPEIPPDIPVPLRRMEQLGRSLTRAHLSPGNRLEPLFNGDAAYPRMLEAIDRAKEHVFLVTYIFNDGTIGQQFSEALIRAAARGVDVRVLLDGVGRFYSRKTPLKALADHGIRVARFLPPRLFPPNLMINLRNHRKILVCDEIAFTGGMNIADYHVLALGSRHPVQDVQFQCTGPIVTEYLRIFLLDWGFATREYDRQLPDRPFLPQGNCYCRVVTDGPGTGSDPLNDLIAGSISNAQTRVYIMTPYFLPTREISSVMRIAAQKGVQVNLILPAKNNLPYVHWASQRVLPALLEAGVRVFYQPPPFAHTKLLCIDSYYCQIGSANYDPRSLRLNFELNTEVFDIDFNSFIRNFMEETMARSREIFLSDLEQQTLFRKLRSSFFWLFSPYL